MTPEAKVKQAALDAGFDLVGIASAQELPASLGHFDSWLEKGYAADMNWMQRQRDKRMDPNLVQAKTQSILSLALVYNTDKPYSLSLPSQPWISRYAWGDDYHSIMDGMLQKLEEQIQQILGDGTHTRRYCDTGPVSEKVWAAAAGLGWVGKHTNLINQKKGSWFFLGEILINQPLSPDLPVADLCGSCTRCLDICPTQAFPQPYVLDASRCVSYLSIEKRGDLADWEGTGLGANLYGCDLCQDVCPWNKEAALTSLPAFEARPQNWDPKTQEILDMDQKTFSQNYSKSPIKRTKLAGLQRNALSVSKNLKSL